ncbi:cell wall-binding repeat-containing protein [Desulfitobacterium hafniense]|uniref:Cell wall-binding protein n=3 Tax=Desulfitobacterium hafniense TaxID=49338 RepID=A0A0W1JLV6_DESHA|nr:cell wall-binding repeat-containing protein [Desulfitobacterium hafniense]ACL19377.1 putative cell wall binding repeat 2-containing protein [Desulfitobacterium hafniense DCB-2]EHL06825.1 putative cell wall binding repeat 2 [Desulfitobacterium hafniense DP7]KTE92595.1 cell wall-binding protein [Desulfitobacterium hafniense]
MKKTRARVVSSVIVAAMVLGTALPAAVLADTQVPAESKVSLNRLHGENRFETAAKVATEGWETSKAAILASGKQENLVDALTAAPFANSIDAPILLTNGADIPEATIEALKTLKVEEIYTVSGAIKKDALEKIFKENNLEIVIKEELGGKDRFETAKNIASHLDDVEGIMVTTAYKYADALSVASIAAAKNIPILLADQDGLPEIEAAYLDEIKDQVKATYVLGGEILISEEVYEELPGTDGESKLRIFGDDRFDTNLEVLKTFTDLEYSKVYVGNGYDEHLVDALVVSALAAKTNSPIVLAQKELSKKAEDLLLPKLGEKSIVAVGGTTAVTDKALTFNHVRPQDFAVMQASGVNGYNVGLQIVDGSARDLASVEVTLYRGETVLAKNTSMNKLFNSYPTATQLSSPFNIDGNFSADGYWSYGKWNGSVLDVPTKAVIKVTYLDGRVYEVVNTKLAGNPEDLNQEALNHVKAEDFGVMQASGVNGYNVGFSLVDKLPVDLQSIEVSLVKVETIKDEDGEEQQIKETVLATNTATRAKNAKLFELTGQQLSSPFNIDGSFENDGYWTYGDFNGTVEDVPTKAIITIQYQDGRKFTVQNTELTGDAKLLAAPAIVSGLAEELTVGETVDFAVTTAPNSFVAEPAAATTKVRVKITLTQGKKENMVLQYLENDGTYQALPLNAENSAFYGPETGFPFLNAASQFKVTFSEAGTYKYNLEVVTVAEEGQQSEVLASTKGEVVVTKAPAEGNE